MLAWPRLRKLHHQSHWFKLAVQGSDNRPGKPLAPVTQASYSMVWRVYIAPAFGTRNRNIDDAEVATWRANLAKRVGPKSVLNAVQQLDSLFKHARHFKWTAANPLQTVRKPKYKARVRAITPEEFSAIMNHADEATRLLLRVKVCTGLRASELFGVRFSDISLDTGHITITRQLRDGHVLELKTDKSRRLVPLPQSIVDEMRAQPRRAEGGLVFLSPDGHPIHRSNFRQRIWCPLLERAGIQLDNERGRVTFQSLRHSAATAAIASGMNVKTVQAILGHDSAMTTLNTYADAWDAQTKHPGEDIARIMFGANGSNPVAAKLTEGGESAQVTDSDGAPGEIRSRGPHNGPLPSIT